MGMGLLPLLSSPLLTLFSPILSSPLSLSSVTLGPDPRVHTAPAAVDGRVKPDHDGREVCGLPQLPSSNQPPIRRCNHIKKSLYDVTNRRICR
nr:hypothetical protein SHINE37_41990 [Rhizobiaceae bacterium]